MVIEHKQIVGLDSGPALLKPTSKSSKGGLKRRADTWSGAHLYGNMKGEVSGKVVLKGRWSLIKVAFHQGFHSSTMTIAQLACLQIVLRDQRILPDRPLTVLHDHGTTGLSSGRFL